MAQDLLLTLADFKTAYSISGTTYDTFLTDRLTFVSAAVEGYCARKFIQKTYDQTFYGNAYPNGVKKLFLFHYPVASITTIEEDDVAITEYRVQKPSGRLVSNSLFLAAAEELVVRYVAGYLYADVPHVVKQAVRNIVKEDYDRKLNGMDISLGKDIQRISIPGVISFDFDYTQSSSDRDLAFGQIIGSQANLLDSFRSERIVTSGVPTYVEEVV